MDLHPGEKTIFRAHPSWRSIMSFYVKGAILAIAAGVVAWAASGTGAAVITAVVVVALIAGGGMLMRIGTLYIVTNERLHIRRGIFSRRVQETRLDKVQNVNSDQNVIERLLRVGTVDFDTAGSDDYDFTFRGVANPESVQHAVDDALRAVAPES